MKLSRTARKEKREHGVLIVLVAGGAGFLLTAQKGTAYLNCHPGLRFASVASEELSFR